ncbi:hypothetical protein [Geomonas subterranea]|uniref:Uncharacterized protein n=1 Tax=Geomonas subterranea TaxID=2847989 RepID=A0ABX8LPN8_9BACT|nr:MULTISPECIES: hypothetical protein [Geomonas]QXE92956.1 hypothetical protein KP001_10730 [Geomonas subterranea]QXM08938.1 hypothetical protein KP002_18545 [Geomonas subterranea]
MKRHVFPAAALVALLAAPSWAAPSVDLKQTSDFIAATMMNSTSSARKESYQSVSFQGCRLDYTVSGTYPSGGLYTIRFRDLDFASLDAAGSKTGQDYTDYVVLRFQKPFSYQSLTDTLAVSTTVINVADREAAQSLLEASLRLAGQCR